MNELNEGKELPPSVAGWLEEYKKLKAQIKDLEERADIARSHVELFLNDANLGTVNGMPAIKWVHVEQRRFDQSKALQYLTEEQVADCYKVMTTRQFRPVSQDDL